MASHAGCLAELDSGTKRMASLTRTGMVENRPNANYESRIPSDTNHRANPGRSGKAWLLFTVKGIEPFGSEVRFTRIGP
jgi:hypothetical protein